MNRKMMESAYPEAASLTEDILIKGKMIMGNNATTGMGKASVIHQVIISAATASTLTAPGSTRKGLNNKIKINRNIPAAKAIQSTRCFPAGLAMIVYEVDEW
jgi:hypothetical protein